MNDYVTIPATYDWRLVALSVVIAICASYAALSLAARVTEARDSRRLAWLFGGAIAMGLGIWSMHYTGMLAYRLPIPVYYHIPTVVVSLLAAIAASFVGLFVVSRPRIAEVHVIGGSLLMAGGIVGMHYTGMAAMRLRAMHHWDMTLVALSMLIAVVVAVVAVGLSYLFRDDKKGKFLKLLCAVLMGFAIPAMHYTAMAAVTFTPMNADPDLSYAVDISALANLAIVLATFVVLGSVFLLQQWFGRASVRKRAESRA